MPGSPPFTTPGPSRHLALLAFPHTAATSRAAAPSSTPPDSPSSGIRGTQLTSPPANTAGPYFTRTQMWITNALTWMKFPHRVRPGFVGLAEAPLRGPEGSPGERSSCSPEAPTPCRCLERGPSGRTPEPKEGDKLAAARCESRPHGHPASAAARGGCLGAGKAGEPLHGLPTQTSLLFRPCSTPPLGCRSEWLPTTQAPCPGYQEHLGRGRGLGVWLCPHRLCSLGTRRGRVKLGAPLTLTTPGEALG